MNKWIVPLAVLNLSACSSYQVVRVDGPDQGVDVLYSAPTRQYEVIGTVSAKRYKPGWTDPTVSDALPQLKAAGKDVGADAVIVRHTTKDGSRHIVVEAEAIRYLQ